MIVSPPMVSFKQQLRILCAVLCVFPHFAQAKTAESPCIPVPDGVNAPVVRIADLPPITGNAEADRHIREIAEARGYRPQLVLADKDQLSFPVSVHRCMASAWRELRQAAQAAGHKLSIVSGYRSIERQQQIFNAKLRAFGGDPEKIAAGEQVGTVTRVLEYSAIPGYSRHHSGFAIDLQNNNEGLSSFIHSPAYRWISADAFAVARKFGFVPSYPEELTGQGPQPEPWEFIWVGEAARQFDPRRADPAGAPSGDLLLDAQRILVALYAATDAITVAGQTANPHADLSGEDELPGG